LPFGAAALLVAIAVTLLWRRRFPTLVWLAVGIGSAVYGAVDWADPLIPFAALVALAAVFEFSSSRTRFVILGVTVAIAALSTGLAGDSNALDWWTVTFIVVGGPLAGAYLRTRQNLIDELRQRAEDLEVQRQLEVEGARNAERARVARELHDVVAHHVTLLVVQAEAAASRTEMDDASRRIAFDAVASSGREAMSELRMLIGLLRGDERAPTAPRPSLCRLEELVDGVQASGVGVEMSVTGSVSDLPSAIDLAAYRVVQESLTNVIKHAPGSAAAVSIDVTPSEVVIVVDNDGSVWRDAPTGEFRLGAGLVGMRERVELLGGQLSYLRRQLGGFRVEARIPTVSR
jgi:signal transduction histidine kinase